MAKQMHNKLGCLDCKAASEWEPWRFGESRAPENLPFPWQIHLNLAARKKLRSVRRRTAQREGHQNGQDRAFTPLLSQYASLAAVAGGGDRVLRGYKQRGAGLTPTQPDPGCVDRRYCRPKCPDSDGTAARTPVQSAYQQKHLRSRSVYTFAYQICLYRLRVRAGRCRGLSRCRKTGDRSSKWPAASVLIQRPCGSLHT